jgi:hypothetical protein
MDTFKLQIFISGAPLYLSAPHFYGADPILLSQVEGLSPKKEDHWGYFDLHPVGLTKSSVLI